jgi:hypothetical protein
MMPMQIVREFSQTAYALIGKLTQILANCQRSTAEHLVEKLALILNE